jgi:CrcB protein
MSPLEVFNPVILIGIAIAGGLGSILRFAISKWSGTIPWGILTANAVASFIAGFAAIRFGVSDTWVAILVVGLAGGLSTFSSWAGAVVQMVASGRKAAPAFYTVLTLILSSTAAYLGLILG